MSLSITGQEAVEGRQAPSGQWPPAGLSLTFTVQEAVEERQAHDGQSALARTAEKESAIEFHRVLALLESCCFRRIGGWLLRRRGGIERVAQCQTSEQCAQAKAGILKRFVRVREIADEGVSDTAAIRVESSRDACRILRIITNILAQPLRSRETMTLDVSRDVDRSAVLG